MVSFDLSMEKVLYSGFTRGVWSAVLTVTTILASLLIPLFLVYPEEIQEHVPLLSFCFSIIYAIDLVYSLLYTKHQYRHVTAINEGSYRRYLRTWLWQDILALIPFGIAGLPPWVHLFHLIKLWKVATILRTWQLLVIHYSQVFTMVVFGFWFVNISHWISCGWLALRQTPITQSLYDTYVDALYWCITTLTTVGYGDNVPVGSTEKLYTIMVEILGVGLYGFLIGSVANLISKSDPAKTNYLENMERLTSMIHFRRLPEDLQKRIQNYYTYLWKKKLGFDETGFLETLPGSLQREVSMVLKKDILQTIPLLRDLEENFLEQIAMRLKPEVVTPGDVLFRAGAPGDTMYFVIHGELEVLTADEKKRLSELGEGDFFGEIALFNDVPRTATVKALTYCDLYKLEKTEFEMVVEQYPDIGERVRAMASERANRVN